MTKHTPGPWAVSDGDVTNESGIVIATVQRAGNGETVPNCRLIAAAPDLLEALEAVLAMHCMPTEPKRTYRDNAGAMDKARAALAKARGANSTSPTGTLPDTTQAK
jgi:hypothetical protein